MSKALKSITKKHAISLVFLGLLLLILWYFFFSVANNKKFQIEIELDSLDSTGIPGGISNPALQQLKTITPDLTQPSALEELHLSSNDFKESLPSSIGNLSSLRRLLIEKADGGIFIGHILETSQNILIRDGRILIGDFTEKQAQTHSIDAYSDTDWLRFEGVAGTRYTIEVADGGILIGDGIEMSKDILIHDGGILIGDIIDTDDGFLFIGDSTEILDILIRNGDILIGDFIEAKSDSGILIGDGIETSGDILIYDGGILIGDFIENLPPQHYAQPTVQPNPD